MEIKCALIYKIFIKDKAMGVGGILKKIVIDAPRLGARVGNERVNSLEKKVFRAGLNGHKASNGELFGWH